MWNTYETATSKLQDVRNKSKVSWKETRAANNILSGRKREIYHLKGGIKGEP
jgi:hypothetical protein